MKEIVIPLSRKKNTLLFLGAIGLVILCFWVIQIAETQTRYDPLFVKIVTVAGIILFGLSGINALIKFFDKKPGLIINDEGITDNSSAVCAGLIRWKNITAVHVTEIYGQKLLTIDVDNADEILSRQSWFKKLIMSLNRSYFSSPVHISSSALQYNFQELYDIIEGQLAAHRIA